MLKSVVPSQSLGTVGASDDLNQIGRDDNAEAGRDYTSRIDDLIKRSQRASKTETLLGLNGFPRSLRTPRPAISAAIARRLSFPPLGSLRVSAFASFTTSGRASA